MTCARLLRPDPHEGLPFWTVAPLAVAVADSQRMFAEGLVRCLQDHAGLDVSQEISTTGREIVREVARRNPHVVLLDFWISDMAGPAAARALLKVAPSTKVLFLTEYFIGPVERQRARASGALWFLRKDLALHDVVVAIRAAAATPARLEPTATDERGPDRVSRLTTLTAREIEVLQVLRRGLSIREVADQLSISAGTVKNHIHNILVKTQAHNQVDAMMIAEQEGFISRV